MENLAEQIAKWNDENELIEYNRVRKKQTVEEICRRDEER